ncbi:MAG TPA: AgmX/PglI C-terminal domain-containing protein [Polyangiaceae bacterium]|nr:AgmX/PglI C-terminal domain-containing protein [Polyangiaceae bacterium]
MKVCTYLNAFAGSAMVGVTLFVACGGAQAPASATAPSPGDMSTATDMSPASPGSLATPAASATQPVAAPPVAALASASAKSENGGPDRKMEDIRAVVAGNREAFRACYDRALKAHPGIKGTFVLSFVVNPDGSIKSAEADQRKSEIHAADLETCAASVVKALKFPPSRKGLESQVSYPFDFNPKGPPPPKASGSP